MRIIRISGPKKDKVMARRIKLNIQINNLHSLLNNTAVTDATLRHGGTRQTNDKWNLY